MSNNTESGENWLASRLIFDASLVVGMLGFATTLWGVPGLQQLGFAALVGVACAGASFVLLYGVHELVRHIANKSHRSRDTKEESKGGELSDSKRAHGFKVGAHAVDEESTSLDSLSGDGRPVISEFKSIRRPAFPMEWSVDLIEALDWQVFDDLCVAFWKIKGNSVVNRSEGSISGTQFYLAAAQNKASLLGLVEARSALSKPVSVAEMQALFKRQKVNNLPLGVLMYAGKLSNLVVSYCEEKKIRLIGADNIFQGLSKLTNKQRKTLLQTLIRPDYMIPTCPNCKIKLIKRMRKDTRRLFWGCISYPECHFKLDYIAPH